MTNEQLQEIKRGFIAAMCFFSYWVEEAESKDNELIISDELDSKIDSIVIDFVDSVGGIDKINDLPDQYHPDLGSHLAGVGCDLWHTISGSGVGFWDGDYSEYGDYLTEKAESCCHYFETYISDSGTVYFE